MTSGMTDRSAQLIDGKALAKEVRAEVAARVAELRARGVEPGLTVVLVGEDPASQVYVRNKDRAASEAGFRVDTVRLGADTTQAELERVVDELGADDRVHGILVQLPLPAGLDADAVVRRIAPHKDVDGLHPENVAALVMGTQGLVPCTPAGCIDESNRMSSAPPPQILFDPAVPVMSSPRVSEPMTFSMEMNVSLCASPPMFTLVTRFTFCALVAAERSAVSSPSPPSTVSVP